MEAIEQLQFIVFRCSQEEVEERHLPVKNQRWLKLASLSRHYNRSRKSAANPNHAAVNKHTCWQQPYVKADEGCHGQSSFVRAPTL